MIAYHPREQRSYSPLNWIAVSHASKITRSTILHTTVTRLLPRSANIPVRRELGKNSKQSCIKRTCRSHGSLHIMRMRSTPIRMKENGPFSFCFTGLYVTLLAFVCSFDGCHHCLSSSPECDNRPPGCRP